MITWVGAALAAVLLAIGAVPAVAAAAHSQGAGGATNAGGDPLWRVTVPIEPASFASKDVEALHGPMFILAGQDDVFASPELEVKRLYEQASQVVAIYGDLAGATHGTPL